MHVLYEFTPGGMEFGVLKLVKALNPFLVRSSICSTHAGGDQTLAAPGIPVFELERRDGNDPRLVWRLYRLFRRVRPHVVHTHAWGTLLEGLVAARLARVPIVVHGEHGTLKLRLYQRWLQRHVWSWADQVLSVSNRLSERMSSEIGFPLEKIETIRNGVDPLRFGHMGRDEARVALGLPADGLVIGTVGRLVPVKDHFSLLEALRLLRHEGIEPAVIVAGEGPLRDEISKRAAALGVAHQVRLLGHRSDVETVLAGLDVFVLPSASEGLSNTVLEAMATGLPVVATRVGGADEVVEDGVTGLLVPPGSPDALARAIAEIVRDPARGSSMGAAARRRVETEFALVETVRQYEALYLRLAGSSVPGCVRCE